MKRQKAQGVGLYQNDITKELNKVSFNKTLNTVALNDKYREYCKTTDNPKTFLEFKESLYPVRRKKIAPQKPPVKKISKSEQKELQKLRVEKRKIKRETRKAKKLLQEKISNP